MRYTYKERVIMARKLKVFLAIFFAAITFFTGKAILDKTYAADPYYGTATVTFNSGTDGVFRNGTTTNAVTYNITKKMTKYSHTSNISDDGTANGTFEPTDWAIEAITIPGASSINVKLYKEGNFHLFYYEGNHEDYTKEHANNPDYDTQEYIEDLEFEIPGNSITFAVSSYQTNSYGYYAIVSGKTENGTLCLGDIVNGQYEETIGTNSTAFNGWDTNLDTISTNTTVNATYAAPIASGTYDYVDWRITALNTLEIGQYGTTQTYRNRTSRVPRNYPWYIYRSLIQKVKFIGSVNGTGSFQGMFSNIDRLKEIDFTNLNTTNVTSFTSFASSNPSLQELDVSTLITTNATQFDNMFFNCKQLESLDLSNFNTTNATTMAGMFDNCLSLTYLNMENFNTTNVTDMRNMFLGCQKLTNLDVSNFNTTNVEKMAGMFSYCYQLTNLDLTNFNTSNVTTMSNMFSNDTQLTNLDLASFNTSNVEDMSWMFAYCNKLTALNLSNFDTSNVGSMYYMFWACHDITSINVSNFDTSNVTDMVGMFGECSSLTNLNISNFNTSEVTNMSGMFSGCSNLTSINVSNFNTSNVTDISAMFARCSSLTSLNLSNFDTHTKPPMRDMLDACRNLEQITLGANTILISDCKIPYAWQKVGSSPTLIIAAQDFNSYFTDNSPAGTYVRSVDKFVMIYDSGLMEFKNSNYANPIHGTLHSIYPFDENSIYTSANQVLWKNDRELVKEVYFSTEITPVSTAYWFYGMTNLTKFYPAFTANVISSEGNEYQYTVDRTLDTSNVISMRSMFEGCSSLRSLDLGAFVTNNVENMSHMFANCYNLQNINFNLCVDRGNMIAPMGMTRSDYLNREGFITYNVEDMSYMFYNCKSLRNLYLNDEIKDYFDITPNFSNYNPTIKKVKPTQLNKIETISDDDTCVINSYYFYTDNVTTMAHMFDGCERILTLDISSFDTSNTTDMTDMLKNTNKLKKLVLGEDFNFVTSTSLGNAWIKEDGDLTVYTGSQLEQAYNGSTMAGAYLSQNTSFAILYDSGELVFQYGDGMDPSKGNVIDIYTGFEDEIYTMENIQYNTTLGYNEGTPNTPWAYEVANITKVTFQDEMVPISTAAWFANMVNLTEIENIENLDTSFVKDMSYMFTHCHSLARIDVSSFDTYFVENFAGMFYVCSSLTNIDLSNFDTGNLSTTSYENGSSDFSGFMGMFFKCTNLLSVDFSSLDVKIENLTYGMLSNTPNLRIMSLGPNFKMFYWDDENSTGFINSWQRDGDTIIYRAEDLMSSYNGETMAGVYRKTTPPIPHVLIYDSGEMVFQLGDDIDPTKGTLIADYTNFEENNYINYIDIPWYSNRELVTSVTFADKMFPISTANWFNQFTNLETIENIENLITSKVTTMKYMFASCTNLSNIDLSSFNTKKITDMSKMFYNCQSITNLDLSNFDTHNVTNMSSMFDQCFNLSTLDISTFDTSNVTDMSQMFDRCFKLVNLELTNFNTSKIVNINSMFFYCKELISLDISSFDASNMLYMTNAFAESNKLNILKLGTEWEFSSDSGLTKSWIRDGDNNVYTAAQLMSTYNGATMAGTYRTLVEMNIYEKVKGAMADVNKDFVFNIDLINGDEPVNNTYAYTGSKTGTLNFINGEETFSLIHNQHITIQIPYGYSYEITQSSDGYTVAKENDTGTLTENVNVIFTSTLNGTTPSGILLNLIPYILILIFSIIGILFIKKYKRI